MLNVHHNIRYSIYIVTDYRFCDYFFIFFFFILFFSFLFRRRYVPLQFSPVLLYSDHNAQKKRNEEEKKTKQNMTSKRTQHTIICELRKTQKYLMTLKGRLMLPFRILSHLWFCAVCSV